MADYSFFFIARKAWKRVEWLKMAENALKWMELLKMAGKAGYGWKLLEWLNFALNDSKWLYISVNGWK